MTDLCCDKTEIVTARGFVPAIFSFSTTLIWWTLNHYMMCCHCTSRFFKITVRFVVFPLYKQCKKSRMSVLAESKSALLIFQLWWSFQIDSLIMSHDPRYALEVRSFAPRDDMFFLDWCSPGL